jgi:hypothetical protein
LHHALSGAQAPVAVEVLPAKYADKEEAGRYKPGHHDHDHHLQKINFIMIITSKKRDHLMLTTYKINK